MMAGSYRVARQAGDRPARRFFAAADVTRDRRGDNAVRLNAGGELFPDLAIDVVGGRTIALPRDVTGSPASDRSGAE
jgi:hypothetical protein